MHRSIIYTFYVNVSYLRVLSSLVHFGRPDITCGCGPCPRAPLSPSPATTPSSLSLWAMRSRHRQHRTIADALKRPGRDSRRILTHLWRPGGRPSDTSARQQHVSHALQQRRRPQAQRNMAAGAGGGGGAQRSTLRSPSSTRLTNGTSVRRQATAAGSRPTSDHSGWRPARAREMHYARTRLTSRGRRRDRTLRPGGRMLRRMLQTE